MTTSLPELEDVVEYELLLLHREWPIVSHYGDQLTDDLQETIVQHERWHSLHCLKQLGNKHKV